MRLIEFVGLVLYVSIVLIFSFVILLSLLALNAGGKPPSSRSRSRIFNSRDPENRRFPRWRETMSLEPLDPEVLHYICAVYLAQIHLPRA